MGNGKVLYSHDEKTMEDELGERSFDDLLNSLMSVEAVPVSSHVLKEGKEAVVIIGELRHTKEECERIVEMLEKVDAEVDDDVISALVGVPFVRRQSRGHPLLEAAAQYAPPMGRIALHSPSLEEYEEEERKIINKLGWGIRTTQLTDNFTSQADLLCELNIPIKIRKVEEFGALEHYEMVHKDEKVIVLRKSLGPVAYVIQVDIERNLIVFRYEQSIDGVAINAFKREVLEGLVRKFLESSDVP